MSKAVLDRLVQRYGDEVLATHDELGDDTVVLKRDKLAEIALFLRDDPKTQLNLMRDVTAVDRLELGEQPRFAVVYHLYSIPLKHALRLKILLAEDDLSMPTLSGAWPASNWGEREVWDMYGVRFEGHPDLRRILLYEEFEGFPLRKDYDKRKSQPRCDLRAPERDAIAEYKRWQVLSASHRDKAS